MMRMSLSRNPSNCPVSSSLKLWLRMTWTKKDQSKRDLSFTAPESLCSLVVWAGRYEPKSTTVISLNMSKLWHNCNAIVNDALLIVRIYALDDACTTWRGWRRIPLILNKDLHSFGSTWHLQKNPFEHSADHPEPIVINPTHTQLYCYCIEPAMKLNVKV